MNLFCDSCGHRGPEAAFLPAGAACFTCPGCGEFDVHPDELADTAVLGLAVAAQPDGTPQEAPASIIRLVPRGHLNHGP